MPGRPGATVRNSLRSPAGGRTDKGESARFDGDKELEDIKADDTIPAEDKKLAGDFPAPQKWAVPIAHNVVPLNYRIVEDGYTEEEIKIMVEQAAPGVAEGAWRPPLARGPSIFRLRET